MTTYTTATGATVEAPAPAKYVLLAKADDTLLVTANTRAELAAAKANLFAGIETYSRSTYDREAMAEAAATRTAGPTQADILRLAIARQSLDGRRR